MPFIVWSPESSRHPHHILFFRIQSLDTAYTIPLLERRRSKAFVDVF